MPGTNSLNNFFELRFPTHKPLSVYPNPHYPPLHSPFNPNITMKYIAILAAVAISAVAAQTTEDEGRLYYSEPISGTIWNAGSTHTVSWTNECKPENTGDLEIVLYLGTGGTVQERVPNIDAIGVLNCLKSQSAQVTIPAGLISSNKYSIHVDTAPLQSYSSHFTIKGVDPVTTAPAATSNSTVAPTATAATSATTASTAPSTTTTASDATANPENAAGSLKTLGSAAAVLASAVGFLFI
ncbi:hypothetical protein BGZ76_004392 [Entomortierella beljakovae]|nr:hypothetical protein BGZ76_004392 [Entomortierella beljakovae]